LANHTIEQSDPVLKQIVYLLAKNLHEEGFGDGKTLEELKGIFNYLYLAVISSETHILYDKTERTPHVPIFKFFGQARLLDLQGEQLGDLAKLSAGTTATKIKEWYTLMMTYFEPTVVMEKFAEMLHDSIQRNDIPNCIQTGACDLEILWTLGMELITLTAVSYEGYISVCHRLNILDRNDNLDNIDELIRVRVMVKTTAQDLVKSFLRRRSVADAWCA